MVKTTMKNNPALKKRARGNEYSPNSLFGKGRKFIFLNSQASMTSKTYKTMARENRKYDRNRHPLRIACNSLSMPQLWIDAPVARNTPRRTGYKVKLIRALMTNIQKINRQNFQRDFVTWVLSILFLSTMLLVLYHNNVCQFVNFFKVNCWSYLPVVVAEELPVTAHNILWLKGHNPTTALLPLSSLRGGR